MNQKFTVRRAESSRIDEVDFSNIPFGKEFSDHMFVADYYEGEWCNMEIRPFGYMKMHPSMMALHYGQAIFEGMKATLTADGKPVLFRSEKHAARFNNSARRMYMPEVPESLFLDAVNAIVDIDSQWIPPEKGSAMYLRPFMFATDEFIGVAPSHTYKFIIFALPVGPYYNKPVSLLAERKYVRATHGGVGEAKAAGNYAASLLPASRAKKKGYDQVLWLDGREFKYIQEVGTMNIFFVLEDKVITPITDGAILKGITRDSILKILRWKGIPVEERKIELDEIFEASENGTLKEIFGSGTAAVVANVNKLADGDREITFDESDYQLSKELKSVIDGMRNGTIEDNFGWIKPVVRNVPVS